ncbi:MAG: hypothetical protein HQL47_11990 [Gammaproteobacteria bacterium]|nr:hypothetical protein [Gammaproteobacteria bacterium]
MQYSATNEIDQAAAALIRAWQSCSNKTSLATSESLVPIPEADKRCFVFRGGAVCSMILG